MTTLAQDVGAVFRLVRHLRGASLSDVAKRVGLSGTAGIVQLEAGQRNWTLGKIESRAKAYGIKLTFRAICTRCGKEVERCGCEGFPEAQVPVSAVPAVPASS